MFNKYTSPCHTLLSDCSSQLVQCVLTGNTTEILNSKKENCKPRAAFIGRAIINLSIEFLLLGQWVTTLVPCEGIWTITHW